MTYINEYAERIANEPFENKKDKEIFEMSLDNYIKQKDIKGLTINKLNPLSHKQIQGRNLILWQGDITKLQVDAIVNAAKKTLLGGGGIDGAIHKASGGLLLRECASLCGCETGDAKVTKGYNLPSKTVIHTVGPIYYKDPEGAEVKLRSCYRRCLEICDEHHFHSIAFCLVSCGIYGYPVKEGAQVSQDVVTDYLNRNPNTSLTDIVFTVFSNADAEIFHQVFDRNVKKEKDGLKEGKVGIEQKKKEIEIKQQQEKEKEPKRKEKENQQLIQKPLEIMKTEEKDQQKEKEQKKELEQKKESDQKKEQQKRKEKQGKELEAKFGQEKSHEKPKDKSNEKYIQLTKENRKEKEKENDKQKIKVIPKKKENEQVKIEPQGKPKGKPKEKQMDKQPIKKK